MNNFYSRGSDGVERRIHYHIFMDYYKFGNISNINVGPDEICLYFMEAVNQPSNGRSSVVTILEDI